MCQDLPGAPPAISAALKNLQARPCVDHVYEAFPNTYADGGTLVLSGEPRVGKTVAMYFAFVLAKSILIGRTLDSEQDRWTSYQNETRPQILAGEAPVEPVREDGETDVSFSARKTFYFMHKRRYDTAVEGMPPPDLDAMDRAESGMPVRFNVHRASDVIRSAWDDSRWLDTLRKDGSLLGIDDMGTEHMTDRGYQLSLWDDLFDYRHRYRLPTIITTNLHPEQFRERYQHAEYGERIYGRLRENGRWFHVKSKGENK